LSEFGQVGTGNGGEDFEEKDKKMGPNIKQCLHAWYLDDGTLVGDSEQVAKALDIIWVFGPELGLELNIRKTEIFWPPCDGNKHRGGLFPAEIGRPTLGVKLLGGAVSRDKGFIEGLAMKRASRAAELMHLLPQLRDPQSELLLLRSCMGIAKIFFGLRTCQPIHMEEAAMLFDKELREAVEDIVVGRGPFFGDLQWRLASLPIRFGGLGLYSALEASSYAFVASRAQSWVLQDHILRDSRLCGMDSDFDNDLDGFMVRFQILMLAVLLAKTPSLLKHNMFWRVLVLLKVFRIWKLSLT